MFKADDYRLRIKGLEETLGEAKYALDIDNISVHLKELKAEQEKPEVWQDLERSARIGREISTIENKIAAYEKGKKALEEKSAAISATVPSRSLAELSRLLGDSDNLLRVYVEKNYLLVALENTKLLTRLLVSGQYIRYDNIIPRDFVTTLLVNKNNFERSLATASIMSRGDKNNLVVLDIEEYNMNISSTSQYGTAKENVAVSLTGKDVRCAYNSKYLDDCLKVINAETIKMQFAQHSSCVITINNSDEVLYFILPVKQIV